MRKLVGNRYHRYQSSVVPSGKSRRMTTFLLDLSTGRTFGSSRKTGIKISKFCSLTSNEIPQSRVFHRYHRRMQLGPTPSFFVHPPPDVWILQLQLLPGKVAIGDQTRRCKWFWMKHCIFGIIKGIPYIWQHKEPKWPTWNEIRSKFTPVLSLPPGFAIGRAKAKPRWGCTFASLEANPFSTPEKYESMHEQTYFSKNGAHLWIHFVGQELVFDQTLFGQHRLQSFLAHTAAWKWWYIISPPKATK